MRVLPDARPPPPQRLLLAHRRRRAAVNRDVDAPVVVVFSRQERAHAIPHAHPRRRLAALPAGDDRPDDEDGDGDPSCRCGPDRRQVGRDEALVGECKQERDHPKLARSQPYEPKDLREERTPT